MTPEQVSAWLKVLVGPLTALGGGLFFFLVFFGEAVYDLLMAFARKTDASQPEPPRWLTDEHKSALRVLKTKTGKATQQEVLQDALAVYEWVVREYEAGRSPLPGYLAQHQQIQRAIRLREGGE